jgi:hypothetical protein
LCSAQITLVIELNKRPEGSKVAVWAGAVHQELLAGNCALRVARGAYNYA